MKPLLFQIPRTENGSIRLQRDILPYFYDHFHLHPECQITYIIKGEGDCMIGDYTGRFAAGDCFLLGPNLPHVFRSDRMYYQTNEGVASQSLFFRMDAFGAGFLDIPEAKAVRLLLEKGASGLRFSREAARKFTEFYHEMERLDGLSKLLTAIQLLQTMAEDQAAGILSLNAFHQPQAAREHQREDQVFSFLLSGYHQDISLEKVADQAHMSPTAFCRWFKSRTGKTFISFLQELRINQACRLLRQTETSVAEIALQCGFQNLSNFNRRFKLHTGKTPLVYRKQMQV